MKEINVLKYETLSIKLPKIIGADCRIEREEHSIDIDIKRESETATIQLLDRVTNQKIGEIDKIKATAELEQARKNGSQVIYATIMIEHQLNDLIADYLFGNSVPNPKRDFFLDHILCTSHIEFSAKMAWIKKIINKIEFFKDSSVQNAKNRKVANAKMHEFDDLLRRIMNYRNAFAHGKLKYETPTGCVLDYHSGDHKNHNLNDEFWAKLENEYARLIAILKSIKNVFTEPIPRL